MSTPVPDPIDTVGTYPTTRTVRAGLRANAAFSLLSGLAMVVAGPALTGPWGLGPWWLTSGIGAGVLAFAVMVAWAAVQPAGRLRGLALAVSAADAAWVAASIVVLVVVPPAAGGVIAVAAVAVAIAAVGTWQLFGLALSRVPHDPLADLEIIEIARTIPAAPPIVWQLITDHDLYGRLAPNLHTVEVISAPGEPLQRRCTAASGDSWEETCSLWDDGRRYAVDIDTTSYPYPLASMHGLWQVDPAPAGSRVTMRFAYRAQPSIRGGLYVLAARPVFPLALRRILTGWRRLALKAGNSVPVAH